MSGLRIEQEGKPAQELDFRQLAELDGQIADVGALIPGRVGGAEGGVAKTTSSGRVRAGTAGRPETCETAGDRWYSGRHGRQHERARAAFAFGEEEDAVRLKALILVVAVFATASVAAGQEWAPPRTADGHPDLQGVWANNNVTPLQRPEILGERETLTDEEVAALQARAGELFNDAAGDAAFGDSVFAAALAEAESFSSRDRATGNYNHFWMVERDWDNRTSLIVDPPNGRLPARTEAADVRAAARAEARARHAWGPEDRSLGERCITGFNSGPPMLPAAYNMNVQIFQTADHVVILNEMVHNARIVPLDGSDHGTVPMWTGVSRGQWEGDTLVVETKNFLRETSFRNSSENLHLVERFRRMSDDVLLYSFTVTDPTTWTQPWSVELPMRLSDLPLFEYACHEGNYGMDGTLTGARAVEKATGE